MSWTTAADVRNQLAKAWERGELLAGLVTGVPMAPRRLLLKGPDARDMTERFDAVRQWIVTLRAIPPLRVEMREFRHRVLGANAVPAELWIDTLDDALKLLGKQRDAARFRSLVDATRMAQPALLPWLEQRPLRALALADEWDRLLAIVQWIATHPRAGIYLRQIDIAGVHSKFIEARRGVLTELLDLVLPADVVDTTAQGVQQFARRYGLRDKPARVRCRFLDPAQALLPGLQDQDFTMTADSFAGLDAGRLRVFITENEINFLAFPTLPNSLVIFGGGYGFEALRQATWLQRCPVYYWGDIDTHGFAILNQLRHQFSHVESLLMDRATLLAFQTQWVAEKKPSLRDLAFLTADEQALYDDLRDNRVGVNVRLEQEAIGFDWVATALAAVPAPPDKSDSLLR